MGLGRWLVCLALGVVLGVAGCNTGPASGTVSGKVSYKGAPLKGGTVMVFPTGEGKNPVSAEIKEDGTYTAEKVPTGPAKLSVETESLKPPMVMGQGPAGGGGSAGKKYQPPPPDPKVKTEPYAPPDPSERAKRYVKIPEKYSNPDSSGLTTMVKTGNNEFNIEIVDK
jgi:hypothetical protein